MCCSIIKSIPSIMINLVYRIVDETIELSTKCCRKEMDQVCDQCQMDNESNYAYTLYQTIDYEKCKQIEDETYFKMVDRLSAEEILQNRIDGSCLVRPYKEYDQSIKYIATVYAKDNYFHLFIRQCPNGKFTMGREKPMEKYFTKPNDIINFYRLNKIVCSNRFISVRIVLVPIT